MASFTGLTQEHFDMYAPDKWASNVHNLKRMRVKDAMVALCDVSQSVLKADLSGMVRAASDEIPTIMNHKKVDAQWVYWFRDPKAREALASLLDRTILNQASIFFNIAPQDKHLCIAVILRQNELWVGLRIAAGATVDRRNLVAKLSHAWERERFLELLQRVPQDAMMGFEGHTKPLSAYDSVHTIDDLGKLLNDTDETSWSLGHRIEAADAITAGAGLSETIGTWLGALLPIYRYVAWTRENDFIEATKQIQEEKKEKRKQATGFTPGEKVRITGGLFSGKVGVVQEADAKAQVKVLVGKLSVMVASGDLAAAAAR